MKRRLLNLFYPFLIGLITVLIGSFNSRAQGIFRLPLEQLPTMHDRDYWYLGDIPYHVSAFGVVTSAPCYSYNTYMGVTYTDFRYLTRTNFPVLTPIANVVAAASGTLIAKYDGFDDNACGAIDPEGNYVILQHANGLKTKYMQLHKGSILSKPIGSFITEGEKLGNPGVSFAGEGILRFEVGDANNNFIDPFDTDIDCQGVFAVNYSLWKNAAEMQSWAQGNKFMRFEPRYLHSNIYDGCGAELNQLKHHFNYGDVMSLFVYWNGFKDSLLVNVFGPTGLPVTGSQTAKVNFLNLQSFHSRGFQVNLSGVMFIPGTYTAVCQEYSSYNSYQSPVDEIRTYFTVGCTPDYTLNGTITGQQGVIAGNNIYSTQTLNSGSEVDYIAGNEIILNPGFKALLGSDVFIYLESCTGTPRLEDDISDETSEIDIYPNPANDFITIKTTDSLKSNITIYNSTLQVLKTLTIGNEMENKISVEDLPSGIYILKAHTVNGTTQTKFIINR